MLTLEQIRTALADRKLKAVAQETGLHYHTVRRMVAEETPNPTWDTLTRLSNYLTRKPGE